VDNCPVDIFVLAGDDTTVVEEEEGGGGRSGVGLGSSIL
jgi:hypothetical protein